MTKIEDSIDDCLAFSKRLNQALDLRKYPRLGQGRISYVQEIFSLSRAGANKWLHGKAIPHKNRRIQIAEKLGINLNWLETGKGNPTKLDPSIFDASNKLKEIPLISMKECYHLKESLQIKEKKNVILASVDHNKDIFAVTLAGNAMYPRFQEGCILIAERTQDFKDGDFVLAKSYLIPEAIFRQYIIGSDSTYLVAFNQKFEPINVNENTEIFGKVIEVRTVL